MTSGAKTKIVAFTESAYNTTPAVPDGRLLAVQTFPLAANEERATDPTLSGYRGQVRSVADARNVAGNASISLAPQTIGFWLAHLIGRPVTTGAASPYTHTFAVGEGALSLPAGMLFEVDYGPGITVPGRYMRYSGVRINQATFTFPNRGFPSGQIDLLGADYDHEAEAPLDATPTDTGHTAWSAKQIELQLDDGALSVCFDSLTVTIGNDLDADQWCVGHQGVRHSLDEGQFVVSGSGVTHFDTPALMNKALSDTDGKIVITLTRGTGAGTANNEELVLTIPNVVFAAGSPPIDGPRGLRLNANFTAHRTTGEIGVTAVLRNALPTVY